MNSQVISAILKKSNIENRQNIDTRQTGDKDLFYKQWEDKLQKREAQLDSKYQQLKLYSKQLKLQSEELVKQKLELGEKIEKYNKLLEQIISQQNQPTKNGSLTPNTKIRKYGINECQQRVASLLQKIRNTSKNSIKTQQQSYFGNNSEYEDVLFSKRQNHSSSFTGIVNVSGQEQQPPKQEQQLEVQGELMNHQLSLQHMENSQRHFYSKVYEEMNKLKKQL